MSGRPLSEMGFNELRHLAMSKNLKYTFKTKTELIRHLEKNNITSADIQSSKRKRKLKHTETEPQTEDAMDTMDVTDKTDMDTMDVTDKADMDTMDVTDKADMDTMDAIDGTNKVRIHTDNLSEDEVERLKNILKKLYYTNKLTELEKVQKYVFTQLGIL